MHLRRASEIVNLKSKIENSPVAYLNENYLKLQAGYLFPEIARRVREFCEANPDAAASSFVAG